jgi:hypothetical protein
MLACPKCHAGADMLMFVIGRKRYEILEVTDSAIELGCEDGVDEPGEFFTCFDCGHDFEDSSVRDVRWRAR